MPQQDLIILPTGATIPMADVDLRIDTQRFFAPSWNNLEVGPYMTRLQKNQFAGFDVQRANAEAFQRGAPIRDPETGEVIGYQPATPAQLAAGGSASTLGEFVKNVGDTISKPFKPFLSEGFGVTVIVVVAAAFLIWVWFRSRK